MRVASDNTQFLSIFQTSDIGKICLIKDRR